MTISQTDARAAIQSIFASTKCYDLLQNSSKAVVFEASIPFQLAFYALIEHGAFCSSESESARRGASR